MKLSEYIKMLQEFAERVDDLQVVMTQSGYYSRGDLADLYDIPETNIVTFSEAKYKFEDTPGKPYKSRVLIVPAVEHRCIVLGHSH